MLAKVFNYFNYAWTPAILAKAFNEQALRGFQ
jgi:hypothetical protein